MILTFAPISPLANSNSLRAMYKRRVSRRFYTLILNRVVADFLIVFSSTIQAIADAMGSSWSARLWTATGGAVALSFYATTVTYVALLLIKLLSIARPLQMRDGVRMRTCVAVIALSWLLLFASFVLFLVVEEILERAGVIAGIQDAAPVMQSILLMVPPAAYATTLVIYAITSEFTVVYSLSGIKRIFLGHSFLRVALNSAHQEACQPATDAERDH